MCACDWDTRAVTTAAATRAGRGWRQTEGTADRLYFHHHHHFICPIIQQYAHLHEYDSRRAGQQGPIRTITATLKRSIKQ